MDECKENKILNDLEKAEKSILELEKKLAFEKSSFIKKRLREEISRLKNNYMSLQNLQVIDLKMAKKKILKFNNSVEIISKKKIIIEDEFDKIIKIESCIEALIKNCKKIKVEYFVCENSLFLEDVENSVILCFAQQIRLLNCKNILLEGISLTGVFLQKSFDIKIKELKKFESEKNRINQVYDFSEPFDSKNYILL